MQRQQNVSQQPVLHGDREQSSDIIPENILQQQGTADYRGQGGLLPPENQKLDIQQQHQLLQNNDPLSSFVLITRQYNVGTVNLNAMSIINESALLNCVNVDYNISTKYSTKVCKLLVGGIDIACVEGQSKKEAKDAAAAQGLESLRARCYTLKVLKRHTGEESVTVDSVESDLGSNDSSHQENCGSKLLKMFGYSDGTGTTVPIKLEAVKGSQGMDLKVAGDVTDQFKQSIEKIVQDYKSSDRQDDLIFSPEFSKEQRTEIHRIAHYIDLKGQSTGSGINRFIAISRKEKFGKINVLQDVLKMGGETEKYKLLKPSEPWYNDE